MTTESGDHRSLPELITDIFTDAAELVRTETSLIRSDISDKIRQVEIGGGSIVAGAICLMVALLVLTQAIVIALSPLVGPGWASLIVGLVFAGIGGLLVLKGRRDLAPASLMPERAANQLNKDAKLVREQTQ